jgi:hypothetical protein
MGFGPSHLTSVIGGFEFIHGYREAIELEYDYFRITVGKRKE